MRNKVIHGTAEDVLAKLPDSSIDHIITDPPYNISGNEKQTMVGPNIVPANFGDWDTEDKDQYDRKFASLLGEFSRIAKPGANALIWLDRAYTGVAWFMAATLGWTPRNIIAAIKRNPSKRFEARHNLKSAWESCLWLSKGPVKTIHWDKSRGLDRNVFFYNIGVDKKTKHPCEKYESMIEPLVDMFTNVGDLVIDPFCGTGSTAVVCKKKGRHYLVSDKDKEWLKDAIHRLDSTVKPIY